LRGIVPLWCLVLSSSREEGLTLSLLSKCVLEGAGWLYSVAGVYAFNKLFCFSDIDCTLFNVHVVHDKGWFHNIFQDTWCESFEEEGDCFSIAYGMAGLPG
jgi:hypothetical protein